MKTRKLSYWIGLLCLAVLILMPDITVNAQTEPDGQGSDEQMPKQMPKEVGVQGTDTKTSEEQQPPAKQQPSEEKQTLEEKQPPEEKQPSEEKQTAEEKQTSEGVWTKENEEKAREFIQQRREAEQSLLEVGCQLVSSKPVKSGPIDWDLNVYDCPAGFSIEGLMREADRSLIEGGCQNVKTTTSPRDGTVWNHYNCPPGSKFYYDWPPGGGGDARQWNWNCLVSPDPAWVPYWMVNTGIHPVLEVDADLMSGQCVPAIGPQGGVRKRSTKDGQSPRPINVEKIADPASYDSEGESDQQQAQSDQQANGGDVAQVDEEARGEEARGEENKALNQSQAINNSKQGYGCSANP